MRAHPCARVARADRSGAITPMAATMVASNMASVLAIRPSTLSRQAGRHHQAREHGGAPRHEGKRRPIGEQDCRERADQRGDAVEPDGAERLRNPKRLPGLHRAGLQPIDTDRLLVANLVLEPDVDIVASLDHLLGGLREARLVAIGRRDREEARQDAENVTSRSTRSARAWLWVAKSTTIVRLCVRSLRSPLVVTAIVSEVLHP